MYKKAIRTATLALVITLMGVAAAHAADSRVGSGVPYSFDIKYSVIGTTYHTFYSGSATVTGKATAYNTNTGGTITPKGTFKVGQYAGASSPNMLVTGTTRTCTMTGCWSGSSRVTVIRTDTGGYDPLYTAIRGSGYIKQ